MKCKRGRLRVFTFFSLAQKRGRSEIFTFFSLAQKRGAAHFEMIVGFVFFIGAVFFLFSILTPWDVSSLPNSAIEQLYDSFYGAVYTNLSTVLVESKEDHSGKNICYTIYLPDELFRYEIGNSSVMRLGGTTINSDLDSGDLNLNFKDVGPSAYPSKDIFRVAVSPEFPDKYSYFGCDPLDDFELGGVVEFEVFSNSSLTEMRDEYYSDRGALKVKLNFPDIFDFAIIFPSRPGLTMEPIGGVPGGSEVLAKEYVGKILYENAVLENERFIIKIW